MTLPISASGKRVRKLVGSSALSARMLDIGIGTVAMLLGGAVVGRVSGSARHDIWRF